MKPVVRWQALAVSMLLFAGVAYVVGKADYVPKRRSLEYFPIEVAGYAGKHVPVSNEALRQLDLTDYLSRNYTRDGQIVNVYVGFHGTQERGSILHSPQHCLPANGWYIASRERVTLARLGPDRPVNRLEVAFGPNRQLVYYWYQGRGRVLAGEYQAALFRAWDAATQNRTDEALVRFITDDDDEDSERRLREFITEVVTLLPAYLPD